MLTPHDVHYGRAPEVLAQRQRTLEAAWAAHPERFVRGIPKITPLPEEVWINPPPVSSTTGAYSGDRDHLDRLIVITQIGHRDHPDR